MNRHNHDSVKQIHLPRSQKGGGTCGDEALDASHKHMGGQAEVDGNQAMRNANANANKTQIQTLSTNSKLILPPPSVPNTDMYGDDGGSTGDSDEYSEAPGEEHSEDESQHLSEDDAQSSASNMSDPSESAEELVQDTEEEHDAASEDPSDIVIEPNAAVNAVQYKDAATWDAVPDADADPNANLDVDDDESDTEEENDMSGGDMSEDAEFRGDGGDDTASQRSDGTVKTADILASDPHYFGLSELLTSTSATRLNIPDILLQIVTALERLNGNVERVSNAIASAAIDVVNRMPEPYSIVSNAKKATATNNAAQTAQGMAPPLTVPPPSPSPSPPQPPSPPLPAAGDMLAVQVKAQTAVHVDAAVEPVQAKKETFSLFGRN